MRSGSWLTACLEKGFPHHMIPFKNNDLVGCSKKPTFQQAIHVANSLFEIIAGAFLEIKMSSVHTNHMWSMYHLPLLPRNTR